MIFGKPEESVVDKKIADCPAITTVEIDAIAPRSMVAVGEKLRRVRVKVISFRAEMVIDHIEHHHDAAAMSALNKFFEVVGPAVAAIGGKWKDAIVTPVPL